MTFTGILPVRNKTRIDVDDDNGDDDNDDYHDDDVDDDNTHNNNNANTSFHWGLGRRSG